MRVPGEAEDDARLGKVAHVTTEDVRGEGTPRGTRTPVRGASTIFSDFVSMIGGRFVSVLLSLVSVLIATRILSPSAYGGLAYLNVVALSIFALTAQWTSTSVTRYGREEVDRTGSMVAVTWSRFLVTVP